MSSGWATMQRARLMRRSSGPVKSFRGANLSLAACLVEQLASAGECLGRDASAHHPGELRGALVVGAQLAHRHDVAPIRAWGFLDYEVVVGERSDLGQVRHDQYLPLGAESLQAQADLDGGLAADAGVDLIENQGRQAVRIRAHGLDGEHQARELAA